MKKEKIHGSELAKVQREKKKNRIELALPSSPSFRAPTLRRALLRDGLCDKRGRFQEMLEVLDRNSKRKKGKSKSSPLGDGSIVARSLRGDDCERGAARREEQPLGRTAAAAAGRLVTKTERSMALEIGRGAEEEEVSGVGEKERKRRRTS